MDIAKCNFIENALLYLMTTDQVVDWWAHLTRGRIYFNKQQKSLHQRLEIHWMINQIFAKNDKTSQSTEPK